MDKHSIDRYYGVPVENISCPGCGQKYGHHNTKVDVNSQECSVCAKDYENTDFVSAKDFIENTLEIKPF